MPPDYADYEDDMPARDFHRLVAETNNERLGHATSCAYGAGAECTCGRTGETMKSWMESEFSPEELAEMRDERVTAADMYGMCSPSGDDVPVGKWRMPTDEDIPF